MANDFDCSIDYLVNEAMRYYARSKNYQPAGQSYTASDPYARSNAEPARAPGRRGAGESPVPSVPPRRPQSAPPQPPSRRAAAQRPDSMSGSPILTLMFNNQRISVDKDQFIIGRGSKTSDLAIKDGNISRKHAAIIRRNGTYYIKDLGSTNGIDYKGMRIDNKRIDEGDVFHLCDYELRFTYR
jgi:hypothetical protein